MSVYKGLLTDNTIDKLVSKALVDATNTEKENRTPSGKLSASMLYMPVQWQVLKTIGVSQKPFDEYTLRKFKRGNHVEEWLISHMLNVIEKQKFVEYKGAIGYVDAIVDSKGYEVEKGIIPHEIKSVSNAKFKRITTAGSPDMGHIYQACFYAMAIDADYFAIDYVSTDDYRIETYVIATEKYKKQVDDAIKAFNDAMALYKATGTIPAFEAKEKWMANVQYNNYPTFVELSADEASKLAKKMKGGN